jgi:hypothetical protein
MSSETEFKAMVGTTVPFITMSGAEYRLCRPSLKIRMLYLEFLEYVKRFEELVPDGKISDELINSSSGEVMQLVQDMLTSAVDLLEVWIKKTHPEIKKEQILEDFDTADMPRLQYVIMNFEEAIRESCPPPGGNRSQRRAAARRK